MNRSVPDDMQRKGYYARLNAIMNETISSNIPCHTLLTQTKIRVTMADQGAKFLDGIDGRPGGSAREQGMGGLCNVDQVF